MLVDANNHHKWLPTIALVLFGSYLSTLQGWKAELAQQRDEIKRSAGMTCTQNLDRAAPVVAQLFTHYVIAVDIV